MLSIYRAFGIDQPYQQNVLSLENPYQIIKISMLTTEMGEKEEKIIREQKNAVFGFFSQIQNCFSLVFLFLLRLHSLKKEKKIYRKRIILTAYNR